MSVYKSSKIDLSEVRKPFIKAGIISSAIGIIVIIVDATLFIRVTNPVI
jgi:hypothetical protein